MTEAKDNSDPLNSSGYRSRLNEAARLSQVVDPDNDPFRSKYAARQVLKDMLPIFEGQLVENANIEYLLGVNYVDTEEIPTGEKHLLRCLDLLASANPTELAIAAISTGAHNQMGMLWSNRSEYQKASEYLSKAIEIYDACKQSLESRKDSNGFIPLAPEEDADQATLESNYTHTVFYYAQVHGHMGHSDLSAKYCQLTLDRQLERKEYNSREWSVNAIGMALYYEGKRRRPDAYFCLEAAEVMSKNKPASEIPLSADALEEEQCHTANIERAWGEFFLSWLKDSAEPLIAAAMSESKDVPTEPPQPRQESDVVPDSNVKPMFRVLELQKPPACDLAKNFSDASAVFVKGLSRFTKSLEFYVLDGYVSEHIAILQSMSALYQNLAHFETDPSRVCKMLKRRIDMLEPIIVEINPTIYQNFYRQLSDEVARAYAEMTQLKIAILRTGNVTGPALGPATQKINQLALNSIKYHQLFVSSFKTREGNDPSHLEDGTQIPYINAKFSIAMMLTKLYSDDWKVLADFHRKSIEEYKSIISWLGRLGISDLENEKLVAEQMMELLPLKIEKMRLTGRSFREWEI